MNSIKKLVPSIILLAIASIFVGIILPGILLYTNHSFYQKDIVNRLDSTTKIKFQQNELARQKIESRRTQIYKQLGDTSQKISSSEINSAISALNSLKKIEEENDRIKISPYYPKNKTLLIWPLLYFGLCSIIFFNTDITRTKISKSYYFIIFILLYFFWRWGAWFRNTSLGKVDRIVYAVNNIDISMLGFFIQEFLSLISLLLLAYIFCKWITHSEILKNKYARQMSPDLSSLFQTVTDLRKRYEQWQIASIFLTVSFGYYTYYFWATINQSHDMRYLPQAIAIHFIWGLSWYVISIPLIITTKHHAYLKDYLSNPTNKNSDSIEYPEKISQIYNIDPISAQNRLITTLASTFTFLFPIIKTLL
ncbi:MAG: hypothetical protein ABI675_21115 [Chitinophagaceae bacterium]